MHLELILMIETVRKPSQIISEKAQVHIASRLIRRSFELESQKSCTVTQSSLIKRQS
jgi:hypothetical protein